MRILSRLSAVCAVAMLAAANPAQAQFPNNRQPLFVPQQRQVLPMPTFNYQPQVRIPAYTPPSQAYRPAPQQQFRPAPPPVQRAPVETYSRRPSPPPPIQPPVSTGSVRTAPPIDGTRRPPTGGAGGGGVANGGLRPPADSRPVPRVVPAPVATGTLSRGGAGSGTAQRVNQVPMPVPVGNSSGPGIICERTPCTPPKTTGGSIASTNVLNPNGAGGKTQTLPASLASGGGQTGTGQNTGQNSGLGNVLNPNGTGGTQTASGQTKIPSTLEEQKQMMAQRLKVEQAKAALDAKSSAEAEKILRDTWRQQNGAEYPNFGPGKQTGGSSTTTSHGSGSTGSGTAGGNAKLDELLAQMKGTSGGGGAATGSQQPKLSSGSWASLSLDDKIKQFGQGQYANTSAGGMIGGGGAPPGGPSCKKPPCPPHGGPASTGASGNGAGSPPPNVPPMLFTSDEKKKAEAEERARKAGGHTGLPPASTPADKAASQTASAGAASASAKAPEAPANSSLQDLKFGPANGNKSGGDPNVLMLGPNGELSAGLKKKPPPGTAVLQKFDPKIAHEDRPVLELSGHAYNKRVIDCYDKKLSSCAPTTVPHTPYSTKEAGLQTLFEYKGTKDRPAMENYKKAAADSGFQANVYVDDKTKPPKMVLAVRGTECVTTGEWIGKSNAECNKDKGQDYDAYRGKAVAQAQLASDYIAALQQKYPGYEISCTGHSLGGYACANAAADNKIQGVVLNPISSPGFSEKNPDANIRSYVHQNEIAHKAYPDIPGTAYEIPNSTFIPATAGTFANSTSATLPSVENSFTAHTSDRSLDDLDAACGAKGCW